MGRQASCGHLIVLVFSLMLLIPRSATALDPSKDAEAWVPISVEDVEEIDGSPAPGPMPAEQVSTDSEPSDQELIEQLRARIEKLEAAQITAPASAEIPKASIPSTESSKPTRPTGKFSMELQGDTYLFGQSRDNIQAVGVMQDGTDFRRARVGWQGSWSIADYKIEFDFAQSGRPTFLDVWMQLNDLPIIHHLKFGHFFEPFSLERLTSNRFAPFLERAMTDQAFTPARNFGVMAFDHNQAENMTWALGVFRTDTNGFGDDVGDLGKISATSRVTYVPYFEKVDDSIYAIHLGVGYSFRLSNNDSIELKAQPEARLGAETPNVPFFVDTGTIASDYFQLWGGEFACVYGPASLQAEYFLVPVDGHHTANTHYQGGYVEALFYLTGESRNYSPVNGRFERTMPRRDFIARGRRGGFCAGPGAWELGFRLSHLDLSDLQVQGGRLTDVTVGLNWYLNGYTKFQLNYVHPFLYQIATGNSDADIYGARFSFDF